MNQAEVALTGDFATVNEVVRQHAPGFATRGFELTGVTLEGSPRLQRFPVFHFLNSRTRMRIDVSFFADARRQKGGFTVLIIRPVNRKLDVEDYLKLHGREELSKSFSYREPNTDVRGFAESFFRMLGGLLDEDLKPIVDGKVFEETPIDWMGYK
jgi:hypothetical protein